jgi:hypothetical protein
MKALVMHEEEPYLVSMSGDMVDYEQLFYFVNDGRWPDECYSMESVVENSKVIAFLTDESQVWK